MERNFPLVSIIVPCRNEKHFIEKCLDSINNQDYPKDKLEVLVIDGASSDGTSIILSKLVQKRLNLRIFFNPRMVTPISMNIGIRNAKGAAIIRMDAHAEYSNDYISKCVQALFSNNNVVNIGNVGGRVAILPSKDTLTARAIAFSISNIAGSAGSTYKISSNDKPIEVDTVFGGCYRREIFEKIGLFDERLTRSQDMEFNMRLKKTGGKIMLFPDIVVNYYPKSNFREFFVHNFWDGVWAVYPLKFVKMPFKLRHYIPLIFFLGLFSLSMIALFWRPAILVLAVSIVFYFAVSLCFSLGIAIREKDWRYVFLMPIAFAIRHFGYGAGSAWGMIRLVTPQNNGGKS